MKKALIIGIFGQDGQYMSNFLLNKNYEVKGISFSKTKRHFSEKFVKCKAVQTIYINNINLELKEILLDFKPDEIYFFSSFSSIFYSYKKPLECFNSNFLNFEKLLDILNNIKLYPKILNILSSDCYHGIDIVNEDSPMSSQSPYGHSKIMSYQLSEFYNNHLGFNIFTAICFNHESFLRRDEFITKKITNFLNKDINEKNSKLKLGDISIIRNWGYVGTFVEAFYKIMQLNKADKFVISSSESYSIKDMLSVMFNAKNLNWLDYVEYDNPAFIRNNDNKSIIGNTQKISKETNWKHDCSFDTLCHKLLNNEI